MPDVNTWLSKFPLLIANPGLIQSLSLSQLEETLAGKADVSDPTNPVILLFENSAVNSAGAILNYETYTRRTYGLLAQTPDDLYTQMSDKDYLNRFAIPAKATFYLLLAEDDLRAALVDTGVNGIKKVTIPRFTAITVNETTFTMQYPIDIRQAASGGLQIVYNQDEVSPVQTLQTNIVPWESEMVNLSIAAGGPIKLIRIELPMQQFAIESHLIKFNWSSGVAQAFSYNDQFFYARAYAIATDGTETEIRTTHTDQTFDPTTPTLLLKDLGGKLAVELPQIYLTNRALGNEIRLDIYTTKGDISMPLEAYEPNSYKIEFNGATPAESVYVSPLTTFKMMSVYSEATATGGADAPTFEELRTQVLTNNLGPVNLPITPTQLNQALSQLGYQPVLNLDNVTDRIVLATRELPPPSAVSADTDSTVSGASLGVQTLVASFKDLVGRAAVKDNGERITLLPDMLYLLVNGQLQVVSDAAVAALKGLALDALVRTLNSATYLYSPFHYVLDSTNNLFEMRAYYLDAPLINTIQFVQENEQAGFEVGTGGKELTRTANGYTLRLKAQSSDSWKNLPDAQVFCQLAFVPEGEKTYAYLNGTLVGLDSTDGERVFEFYLDTNYDIDSADQLVLTSFQMFDDAERKHGTALTGNFEVFWGVIGARGTGVGNTQIDVDMGSQILPEDALGVARERINLTLGKALNNLWRRTRTVAGSGTYQTYLVDEPLTYDKDVYQRDPNTGNVAFTVNNGTIVMTKLHSAGDPVLDSNGNPLYRHKAGDLVLDGNGNPVLVSDGTLVRQMDLVLVEGVYYFATQALAKSYRDSIPQLITTWLTEELAEVGQRLLEKTSLYFYPKVTVGDVKVGVQNGQQLTIPAAQSFGVNFYLDDAAWRNTALRAPLTKTAVDTLTAVLRRKTVSMVSLTNTLAAAVGEAVVGFDITGLGGDKNLTTLTVLDDSTRLSIRKQAVAEADGTLGVTDAVSVDFLKQTTGNGLSGLT